jgi:hypothetical protein
MEVFSVLPLRGGGAETVTQKANGGRPRAERPLIREKRVGEKTKG